MREKEGEMGMKGTGARSKTGEGSTSIGFWLIGILIGAGMIALSVVLIEFVNVAADFDLDVMKWFYFFHMLIWVIGSLMISLSAVIPGFTNSKLPPALRSGLIITGVLALIWSLIWANGIVP
ncbi:MAG: hypothetical protein KAH57_03380 [Thermoplasmata archaeon]|nr:hypothetical protein [Thermoplasmata archaeon]